MTENYRVDKVNHVYAIYHVIPSKLLSNSPEFTNENNKHINEVIARLTNLCVNRWIFSEGGSVNLVNAQISVDMREGNGDTEPRGLRVEVEIRRK